MRFFIFFILFFSLLFAKEDGPTLFMKKCGDEKFFITFPSVPASLLYTELGLPGYFFKSCKDGEDYALFVSRRYSEKEKIISDISKRVGKFEVIDDRVSFCMEGGGALYRVSVIITDRNIYSFFTPRDKGKHENFIGSFSVVSE